MNRMNMKRLSLVFAVLLLAFTQHVHAQYYSVNYDARTVAAMAAAFGTEVVAESYYREQVDDILKHYTAAEVAAAGIFSSKFLEHKALSDLGIWCSSTENYYYRRIYHMVADKIIPKIWVVAKQMLHSPQTAIHWGSYLMKVCDETKSLCMQFESVVTNSTLSFSDIAFLEINSEVVPLLKLSELGGIDWQRMLDDFSRIPDRFTRETCKATLTISTIWVSVWQRPVRVISAMPCCLKVCSITCFRARSARLPTCTTITPVCSRKRNKVSGTCCWTRSVVLATWPACSSSGITTLPAGSVTI